MKIAGIVKNSFVDYPSKITMVVFTPHCNFDCFFCHNRDLISSNESIHEEKEVFDFLKERKNFIDAVTITGGEPTLQGDLKEFIKKIKDMGFLVKLDSNGSNPKIIKELLSENLVDFYAIDYKTPKDKYKEVCGNVDVNKVLESINLLKENKVDFEIRTTLIPGLTIEDIKQMKKEVGNVPMYSFNNYRIPEKYKKSDEILIHQKTLKEDEIKEKI